MIDDADTARGSLLALVATMALAVLAGPVASPAAAHAGSYDLTLEASEDCPDRTYCFEVTEGSLEEVPQGEEIQVTLVNPESNDLQHNVKLTELANADVGGDTDESEAKAGTDTLDPGQEASFEYFVPQGADGLYLWCDFGVHEGEGMYLQVPFTEGATTSGEETNDSPTPGAIAALAGLAAVALLARRT